MNLSRWFLLIIVLLAAFQSRGPLAKEKDRTLTLLFIPQESTGEAVPSLDGAIVTRPIAVSFEDARALPDKTVIGEGSGDDDELFQWRATNDVGKFAGETFTHTATGWGVMIHDGADLRLSVKLVRLFVNERDQAVGSMYAADARIAFVLKDTSGGTLAEGMGAGDARRYGRKRSAGNCNEVLSDAIKEAYANALSDSRLQAAWAGKPSTPTVVAEGISPAELLAQLIKLKKEGFSHDLLIQYVSKQTLRSPFSSDDLVSWKTAGMEEGVIRAALEKSPAPR